MTPLTGKNNRILKLARSLQKKKDRIANGLYFAEGSRLVAEALRDRNDDVEFVIVTDEFCKRNKILLSSLDLTEKTVYNTSESLFKEISSTETPQGIAAVIKIPLPSAPDLDNLGYVLVLDGISEPGNMGTIIRTAEAAGIDAIIMSKGCVDLYNPKVVRSSMGSIFRMNCITGADSTLLGKLKKHGYTIAATALKDSAEIDSAKLDGKRALIIGSEAFGVSDEFLKFSDIKIRIPMEGMAESLNAAVAAGICMYMLKPRG